MLNVPRSFYDAKLTKFIPSFARVPLSTSVAVPRAAWTCRAFIGTTTSKKNCSPIFIWVDGRQHGWSKQETKICINKTTRVFSCNSLCSWSFSQFHSSRSSFVFLSVLLSVYYHPICICVCMRVRWWCWDLTNTSRIIIIILNWICDPFLTLANVKATPTNGRFGIKITR